MTKISRLISRSQIAAALRIHPRTVQRHWHDDQHTYMPSEDWHVPVAAAAEKLQCSEKQLTEWVRK